MALHLRGKRVLVGKRPILRGWGSEDDQREHDRAHIGLSHREDEEKGRPARYNADHINYEVTGSGAFR
jgi:hypothetical protein